MSEEFIVQVGEFEGPLDLLLQLIEKRKLHINDVSLAKVTDRFVAEMRERGQTFSPAATANFILVASTLVLIKSASLLPTLDITPEESANIEELERRLKRYQRFRELAGRLGQSFGRSILFRREPGRKIIPVFSPTPEITAPNILKTIKALLTDFPAEEILPEAVVKKILTLEEAIGDLTRRLEQALNLSFRQFVGGRKKQEVIVSFLGLLELVKQGLVEVKQEAHFQDIAMASQAVTIGSA